MRFLTEQISRRCFFWPAIRGPEYWQRLLYPDHPRSGVRVSGDGGTLKARFPGNETPARAVSGFLPFSFIFLVVGR